MDAVWNSLLIGGECGPSGHSVVFLHEVVLFLDLAYKKILAESFRKKKLKRRRGNHKQ